MTAPHIISSSTPVRRRGFTLIELLVVITVIAILAGLALAGFSRVRQTAGELAITNNVQQLDAAIDKFRTEFGFYPSDFSEFVDNNGDPLGFRANLADKFGGVTVQQRLLQFLAKISPTHNENAVDPAHAGASNRSRLEVWWAEVGVHLASDGVGTYHGEKLRGPQVALWFWLSQLHNDAQFPFSGPRDPADVDRIAPGSERKVFFDFGGQLELVASANYATQDGSHEYGLYRVIQAGGDAPLTYFHHATFMYHEDPTDLMSNQFRTRVDLTGNPNNPDNFAEPIMVDLPVDPVPYPPPSMPVALPFSASSKDFYKPNSYQICTAGWDNTYSNINRKSGTFPVRTIEIYDCRDNIYSFTDGRADLFFDLP